MIRKTYKKAILLCPPKYSINNVFKNILALISDEVVSINIRNYVKRYEININTQIFRFPDSIRSKWISYYQQKINEQLLLDFRRHEPDLIFVYNNEMLLPSTVEKLKKTAKVIFFLGDSPFYTPSNNYFLTLLTMGNLVLAPDTFWIQHMKTVGIKNSFFFVPGIDDYSYHQDPEEEYIKKVKETEIIYCGMSYVNSWGYKKALLMSKFLDYKFEIYGDKHWKTWFNFFPELQNHFHESAFIPTHLLNAMYNKAKLMPVDGNPGILNGIHIRMFEALNAGVLPLIEYRKDVEEIIFSGLNIELPIIRNYAMASALAKQYLTNESLRSMTASAMKNHVLNKYSSDNNANRILEFLSKVEG
jgi:hypothetical protein